MSSLLFLTLCWRNASRTTLLARFLSTAPESVFLLAIIPSLAFFSLLCAKKILKYLSETLWALTTWSKPSSRNNRCLMVNLADLQLDCEFCTAFGAACVNNSTASACLHAHQKAMGTFSFRYGRLVCAFHILSSLVNRKTRYYKALKHVCQV